jgi:hypothetical protein
MVVKTAAEWGAGAQVREEMMTQISIDDGGRGWHLNQSWQEARRGVPLELGGCNTTLHAEWSHTPLRPHLVRLYSTVSEEPKPKEPQIVA